jgi:hypothetical protein
MRLTLLIALFGAILIPIGPARGQPKQPNVRKLLDQQLGKTMTISFLVASIESDGPGAELRLIPFDPPGWRPGKPCSVTAVTLTPKVQMQFRRIGIADLEAHLRGKTVRVNARVAANWLIDGQDYQERLAVEDITQFEAVEQHRY